MYANADMVEARRLLLGTEPDFDIVYAEGLADAALELVPKAAIDVLIVDVRLRGLSGIDFVTKLHRRYLNPETTLPKVIVVAPFFSNELLLQAIRAGATDLVTEEDGAEELINAIKSAMASSRTIDYAELKTFFELTGLQPGSNQRWLLRLSGLSEREAKVLVLIEHGIAEEEIAKTLNLTETSVRRSIELIMATASIATRWQLVLALFEAGVLYADQKVPAALSN